MKEALGLAIFLASTVLAQAAMLRDDAFDYPDGPLVTASGGIWAHHSGTAPGEVTISLPPLALVLFRISDRCFKYNSTLGGLLSMRRAASRRQRDRDGARLNALERFGQRPTCVADLLCQRDALLAQLPRRLGHGARSYATRLAADAAVER